MMVLSAFMVVLSEVAGKAKMLNLNRGSVHPRLIQRFG
jgi:hypothetical protein